MDPCCLVFYLGHKCSLPASWCQQGTSADPPCWCEPWSSVCPQHGEFQVGALSVCKNVSLYFSFQWWIEFLYHFCCLDVTLSSKATCRRKSLCKYTVPGYLQSIRTSGRDLRQLVTSHPLSRAERQERMPVQCPVVFATSYGSRPQTRERWHPQWAGSSHMNELHQADTPSP